MPKLGQQRDPKLVEVLRYLADTISAKMHVSMPGKVESYDAATQTADVTPLVKIPWIDTEGEVQYDEIPKMLQLPVMWPRAGDFFITMPLAKGDFVEIRFADVAIEDFQMGTGGAVTEPKALRYHDLSDAYVTPGLYPILKPLIDGATNKSKLALGVDKKGTQIHIDKTSIQIKIGTATLFDGSATAITIEAAGSTIDISATGVDINGNLTVLP